MSTMIEVKNIGKHFGHIKAVDSISFTVEKGEVLGFLGPNGAGKTTTMKMLTCFLSPTFGTASICGNDIINDSMSVRKSVGYMPESSAAYNEMNVKSFLEFIAEVRGFDGGKRSESVERVVESTNLKSVINQEIDTLSKGFRSRVSLAQALIHNPPVLILDEPTDGLDPNQKHEVRSLINELATDKAIILSTHILEEVDAVCSRAIIIASGRIVADGTPDELRNKSSLSGAVNIGILLDSSQEAYDVFLGLKDVHSVEILSSSNAIKRYLVVPEYGKKIDQEILKVIHDKKWVIEDFAVEKGRLDQVFRSLTTDIGDLS